MDDIQKFNDLKTAVADISNKKIRLEERFKNEKDKLEKLLTQITIKGYDPKKLSEIRKQKEADLKALIEKLQTEVQTIQAQITSIESN